MGEKISKKTARSLLSCELDGSIVSLQVEGGNFSITINKALHGSILEDKWMPQHAYRETESQEGGGSAILMVIVYTSLINIPRRSQGGDPRLSSSLEEEVRGEAQCHAE